MWPRSEPAESFRYRSRVGRYRLRVRARIPEDLKYNLPTLLLRETSISDESNVICDLDFRHFRNHFVVSRLER